ncbi:MAG: YfhO family protein, partial [Chitinophagaceae bacterium]|nr:YfhO family protein [Chitinophagaceae bacterium]
MNKSLWQRVQPHAIAIGIFFIVSCVYCFPALQGLVVAQSDATGWQGMAHQSIVFYEKHGHYPLWTNSTFSGMPAFQILTGPTFNITIAYLHHLFMLFLPEPAGLFFLACLGFYILCLSLNIKNKVAILGSLAYAYSSYSAVIVMVGHTTKFSSMGYAPAVLAGLILLTQRRYLSGFIVTLVFSTQLFYQNHLQIAYYTFLIAACLGIAYALQAIRKKETGHLVKAGGLAIAALVMGMLSYAVILLPTYDYARETMRGGRSELTKPGKPADNKSHGGLDKDYAFGYSYGITEVLTIAVPRMFGGSSGELPPGSKTASAFAEKTGMSEEQAEESVQNFPAYWGPQGGTSGAVYFGAIICVLFIFGLIYYKGWHSQWIIAATILGILLAWGKNFPAFNYFLFDHLPFYNKFRAPSMAMVIPQLTFPLMAALGLNSLFENSAGKESFWKKFKLASTISGIFIAVLVLLYFSLDYKSDNDGNTRAQLSSSMLQQMSQHGQPTAEMRTQADDFGRSVSNALKEDRRSLYGGDLFRSLIFIALAFGILYAFGKDKINKNIATIGLAALVFIDLIGVDLRYLSSKNYLEKDTFSEAFTPNKADLQVMQDTSYYRVYNSDGDPFQMSGSTSRTSYLHNSIGGYHPAKLALYEDLIRQQLEKGNLQVFNMLNTKYFIVTNPADRQQVAQLNPDALGPAWFVKAIKYVDNANEEMKALDNFHPKDTAIIDKKEQSKITGAPGQDSSASIQLVQNDNDYILYKSSSKANGFAVFSEIYYPNGWKASIDGKEVPIVKADYALRGLSVPAGGHRIEFKFEPSSYT